MGGFSDLFGPGEPEPSGGGFADLFRPAQPRSGWQAEEDWPGEGWSPAGGWWVNRSTGEKRPRGSSVLAESGLPGTTSDEPATGAEQQRSGGILEGAIDAAAAATARLPADLSVAATMAPRAAVRSLTAPLNVPYELITGRESPLTSPMTAHAEAVRRETEPLRSFVEEHMAPAPARLRDDPVRAVAQAVGGSAPDLAAVVATGGAYAPVIGGRVAGSTYDDLRDRGVEPGRASDYAVSVAGVSAYLERIGALGILNRLAFARPREAAGLVTRVALAAEAEGSTEIAQGATEIAARIAATGEVPKAADVLEELATQGLAGAFGGGAARATIEAPNLIKAPVAVREKLAESIMTEDQRRMVQGIDEKTGLYGHDAWKRAVPRFDADPDTVIVAADAIGLKSVNDILGGENAGDAAVIQPNARAWADAARQAGIPSRQVFRGGGDELYAAVPRDSLEDFLAAAQAHFSPRFVEAPGGYVPLAATVGYGDTFAEAEAMVKATKKEDPIRGSFVRGGIVPADQLPEGAEVLSFGEATRRWKEPTIDLGPERPRVELGDVVERGAPGQDPGGRIQQWLRGNFTWSRGLPTGLFRTREAHDFQKRSSIQQVEWLDRGYRDAFKRYVKETPGVDPAALSAQAFEYYSGEQTADPPAALRPHLDAIRSATDDITEALLDIAIQNQVVPEDQIPIMRQQIGQYVRRSYIAQRNQQRLAEVVDTPLWQEVKGSLRTMVESAMAEDPREEGIAPAEAARRSDLRQAVAKWKILPNVEDVPPEAVEGEIDRILEREMRASFDRFGKPAIEWQAGALPTLKPNLSIFEEVTDVPEPIRRLWGEDREVSSSFLRGTEAMLSTLHQARAVTDMAERFEGVLFFDRKNAPVEAHAIIPDDPSYGPLAGKYTTPYLKKTIQEAYETGHRFAFFQAANFWIKGGYTVFSPRAANRNFFSNFQNLAAAGHLIAVPGSGAKPVENIIRGLATGKDFVLGKKKAGTKDMLGALARQGLLSAAIDANEFAALAGDMSAFAGIDIADRSGKARFARAARKYYEGGDVVAKAVALAGEMQNEAWIDPDATQEEIEARAGEKVRRMQQNYGRLPRALQKWRQNFFMGPFISFHVGSAQNFFNIAEQGIREATQGRNTREKLIGAKRLASLSAVTTATVAGETIAGTIIYSLVKQALTGEPEKVKKLDDGARHFRVLAPQYLRGSNYVPLEVAPNRFVLTDVSYMAYFAPVTDAVDEMARTLEYDEATAGDAILEGLARFSEAFLEEEPFLGSLMDVNRGQTVEGYPVRNPGDKPSVQIVDSMLHVAHRLAPSVLRDLQRGAEAVAGIEGRGGQDRSVPMELIRFAGPSVVGYRINRRIESTAKRLRRRRDDLSGSAREALLDLNRPVGLGIHARERFDSAQRGIRRAYEDAYAMVEAGKFFELPPREIEMAVRTPGGFGKDDYRTLARFGPQAAYDAYWREASGRMANDTADSLRKRCTDWESDHVGDTMAQKRKQQEYQALFAEAWTLLGRTGQPPSIF